MFHMTAHSDIRSFTHKSKCFLGTLRVLLFLLILSSALAVFAQTCVPYPLEGTSMVTCEAKVIDLGSEHSPLEQSLSPGKTKCYSLSVQEGQFVRVVINQLGTDVGTTLYGPQPKREMLQVVDTPSNAEGNEA